MTTKSIMCLWPINSRPQRKIYLEIRELDDRKDLEAEGFLCKESLLRD